MGRIQGIIFDVDGTLVDSNDAHTHAWVKAFGAHGVWVPFDRVRPLIGMGADKLIPEVTRHTHDSPQGKAITQRKAAVFRDEHLPRILAFPKVKELLERLRAEGFQLTVASSAERDELEALLKLAGAPELADVGASSDDASRSKPDPDVIHAALRALGLGPSACLMVGDTPYDVEAAARAGVPLVALRCGGWKDEDLRGAAAVRDDPADLLASFPHWLPDGAADENPRKQ